MGRLESDCRRHMRNCPGLSWGILTRLPAGGAGRRGVQTIRSFYGRLLGMEHLEGIYRAMETENPGLIPFRQIEESALAAAVNGCVFRDDEGIFSQIRTLLTDHYPERLRYLRIAEAAARFCQYGQYNSGRMLQRGDRLSSRILLGRAVQEALKLVYYMEGQFPPHDKWLAEGVRRLGGNGDYVGGHRPGGNGDYAGATDRVVTVTMRESADWSATATMRESKGGSEAAIMRVPIGRQATVAMGRCCGRFRQHWRAGKKTPVGLWNRWEDCWPTDCIRRAISAI